MAGLASLATVAAAVFLVYGIAGLAGGAALVLPPTTLGYATPGVLAALFPLAALDHWLADGFWKLTGHDRDCGSPAPLSRLAGLSGAFFGVAQGAVDGAAAGSRLAADGGGRWGGRRAGRWPRSTRR